MELSSLLATRSYEDGQGGQKAKLKTVHMGGSQNWGPF